MVTITVCNIFGILRINLSLRHRCPYLTNVDVTAFVLSCKLRQGSNNATKAQLRLAIAPGPTVHWLFKSHDLPSKFSAIASRLCDRLNREVKHVHPSPLSRKFVVVSAFSCA